MFGSGEGEDELWSDRLREDLGEGFGVVNLAFLLCGVLAAAFAVGRALGGPRPPVTRDAAPAARAGSGSGGAR